MSTSRQRKNEASKERKKRLRAEKKKERQTISCLEKKLQELVHQIQSDLNKEFISPPAPEEPYGDEFVNRKKMTRHKSPNLMVSKFIFLVHSNFS